MGNFKIDKKIMSDNWSIYFMSIGVGGLAEISFNDIMSGLFYTLSVVGLIINLIKEKQKWNK